MNIRQYIKESNAIEGVYTEAAIDKSVEAWRYLKDQEELSHEVVKRTHELIMEERQPDIAGEYKDQYNWVNLQEGMKVKVFCPPKKIGDKMNEMLEWTPSSKEEAFEWKKAFTNIHPFVDGNGRASRLLYAYICEEVVRVEPRMFLERNKKEYFKELNQTEELPIDTEAREMHLSDWRQELEEMR